MENLDHDIQQLVTKAALGSVGAGLSDGSFYDLDADDASTLAAAGCANDDLLATTSQITGAPATPQVVHDILMSRYFDAQLSRTMGFGIGMSERKEIAMGEERTKSMFARAGMTEDDASRVIFDAGNGDYSPLLRVKENYYFG